MLQKQPITIPLGLGINTKTDEKMVEQGQFNLVCENATFEKVGAVKKRLSYKALPTNYYNATETGDLSFLSQPISTIAAYGESTFLRNRDGEYFYGYKDALVKGTFSPIRECTISSEKIATGETLYDMEYDPDEKIIAACVEKTIHLFDYEKKTTIKGSEITAGVQFRVGATRVADESFFHLIRTEAGNLLKVKTYDKNCQSSIADLSFSNVTSTSFAVTKSDDKETYFIIVPTTTANTGRFIAISAGVTTVNTTFACTGITWSGTARYDEVNNKVMFAYATGTSLRQIVFNPNGTISTADTNLSLPSYITTDGVGQIAYAKDENVIYIGGTHLYKYASGTYSVVNYNTSLASDKVSIGGAPSILVRGSVNEASVDSPVFGTQGSGKTIFARVESAGFTPYCRSVKISDDVSAMLIKREIETKAYFGTSNSSGAYVIEVLFFDVSVKPSSKATIKNLHFSGGFLQEFDGEKVMENGFHIQCPRVSNNVGGLVPGFMTGTYGFCTVLKYVDANGQITRSEPANFLLDSVLSNQAYSLAFEAVPYGIKTDGCVIEFYRTTNGGSTFYLADEFETDMYNSNGMAYVGLKTHDKADSVITGNRILYTAGNVLANNPGPACKAITQGGNRLFLFGLQDDNEIAYSFKKKYGECVNFSDFFRIRFDTSQYNVAGGVTCGAYMDGKLIVFKKDAIFYIMGDGPNDLGLDSSFTEPELVTSVTGCENPASVILTPVGVMFKGEKGIYLLTRGLETQYIGSGVEAYNQLTITSASHVGSRNEIVFTAISEVPGEKYQLVFDYFSQQWSVTTGISAVDGDVLNGDHILIDGNTNYPLIQNGEDFIDDVLDPYSVRVKTPWIKISGLQDFARIWSATILGKYKSEHVLNVKVYYDYNESTYDEYNVEPSVSDSQYQYRIHLKKQKCQAIQFEIRDENQVGESMELTALTLEVGLKKGSIKVPTGRSY